MGSAFFGLVDCYFNSLLFRIVCYLHCSRMANTLAKCFIKIAPIGWNKWQTSRRCPSLSAANNVYKCRSSHIFSALAFIMNGEDAIELHMKNSRPLTCSGPCAWCCVDSCWVSVWERIYIIHNDIESTTTTANFFCIVPVCCSCLHHCTLLFWASCNPLRPINYSFSFGLSRKT